MIRNWRSRDVTAEERRHFVESVLLPGNLRRLFWFILLFLPVTLSFYVINPILPPLEAVKPWTHFDLGFSVLFLGLVIHARRTAGLVRWKQGLVVAYCVYLLVSMDGYYFSALQDVGETPAYVLGVVMLGVLFHLPPSLFLLLILGNHAVYLALVLTSGRGLGGIYTSLFGGTDAVILACLAAWFLFRREWTNFEHAGMLARRNRELAEANAQLQRSNAEMNEIMAIAAHDLRSPLCTLQGLHELLRTEEAWQKEPYAGTLAEFGQISGGMLALVGRLLEAHAVENRAGRRSLQRLEVGGLVTKSVGRMIRLAEAKRIHLATKLADGVEIETDADVVGQALDNLLSNAVKFSPPDTTVTVTLRAGPAACLVEVGDEGPGIPAAESERLFRKFHRGVNRPTANEPSTGLGLFIVRQLIESIGGSVTYRPNQPRGSIFCLTLPMSAQQTG